MAGLLDYISGSKLATALRQYVSDALPGGSLNPESKPVADRARYAAGLLDPNSQISRDTQQWHKKTQSGLTDLLRGKETPQADYAYNQMFNMVGMAPLGMTVWHGSPHRFDKFDMSKIGTGEGAQAYGHGLYMAESPDVALQYSNMRAKPNMEFRANGKLLKGIEASIADDITQNGIAVARINAKANGPEWLDAFDRLKDAKVTRGNLYKADIPDEAVARFLDWDKPLSQQAPEVQKAMRDIGMPLDRTGESAWQGLNFEMGRQHGDTAGKVLPMNPAVASAKLKELGIPGIRYLDAGSRSAGQGSSNFVLFDDQLPRILEINNQPTGLQPWKPGEWK